MHVSTRSMLGAVALTILSVIVCTLSQATNRPAEPARAGQDWPSFRGNPHQTGIAGTTLPQDVHVRWTFKANHLLRSQLVLTGFLASGAAPIVLLPTLQGVQNLSSETVMESFEGTAAIADHTAYVGSMDEYLYAFDLVTGRVKWAYRAGPIKTAVAVHAGAVFVGNLDGVFHCVDAATGHKRWTYDLGNEITSGADFAGDTVLFGSNDQTLYCLSTKDGKERWKFNVPGGPVMGTPAVIGNRTFAAGCDSTLHVIDVATGKGTGGTVDLGGQVGASVAVAGDVLYVGTMTHQVLAVDWKKGEVLWKYEPGERAKEFFASAAVTDSLVVTGSRDKRVHALDRTTGAEVWNFATRNKVDSSPVVVGDRVFAASADGRLYVLDLAKGTEMKNYHLGGEILASPAVGEHCLVIGSTNGTLYCFGAEK
jgi:outer membrane protein assembly factor BamB